MTMQYPDAPRLDLVEEWHGQPVADPYRWLEDPADERTVAWSAAQDELLRAHRERWPLRGRLRERIAQVLSAGMVTAPAWRGDRAFFLRREPGQDHPVLLVREPDGSERALVDPMLLDPSGTTTLDGWAPSHEGDRLAYLLSTGGTEASEVRVLDVSTGALVEGPIDRARHSPVAWLPGGKAYFYVRHLAPEEVPDDNPVLHRRVYLHQVGADPAQDRLVFGADAPRGRYFDLAVSPGGRWLAVIAQQGTDPRNDLWLADLRAGPPEAPPLRPVQVGVDAQTVPRFGPDEDVVHVWTDRDAPRGRVCRLSTVDVCDPDWVTVVPSDPDAVLTGVVALTDRLVVSRARHAVGEVAVHDARSGAVLAAVPLPGMGTVTELAARPTGGTQAWLGHTDFATPPMVLRVDARTGDSGVWATAPGAVPVPDVVTRQVTYRSADGTEVRMFLLSRADHPARPAPTILYGYGGFNVGQAPGYAPLALSWVRAGGVYAVANLRGGNEEGEQWHRAGMLAHKQNVFDDFAAAADWLVDQGWAEPGCLGCYGGSNGGLLVGAALTQHPERFAAVVCSAPLLDMLRYHLFDLGPLWTGEYGCADDAEQFGWLRGYSPYHAVRSGVAYPAVLFTVFEGDTRVNPLHARKMAAALQHAGAGTAPVLVRRETGVGHSTRAVSRTVELGADVLGFFAARLGLVG
jgi:prolyl oligopeptidase